MISPSIETEALRDLVADLRRAGVADIRFDEAHRLLYSTDASMYQIMPIGVVIPRDEEELIATVSVCARHKTPVLPRGAGTSLSGQTVGRAVIVDVSRHLDRILEISTEEQWIRCQPGLVLDHLNSTLQPHGLMLGPDPASGNRATVGGTVGNNGTGAHSILYGMMADQVLATRAVLSDATVATFDDRFLFRRQTGTAARVAAALPRITDEYGDNVRRDFPRHWRRASGYNLDRLLGEHPNPAQLLAGSEGTLAFMSEVTLNIVPRPHKTILGIVHFDNLVASAEATVDILELHPSAVELMDKQLIDLCRQQPEYARRLTFIDGRPACVLAVEFYVDSETEGQSRLAALGKHLASRGHRGSIVPLIEPTAQANAWSVRKVGLGLLLSQRGDAKPMGFMEDVAVPPEHLADYVRSVLALLDEFGKDAAFYAHASAGCLHIRPFMNMKDARDVAAVDEIQARLLELIRPLGGVLSGEHGDGIKLTRLNRQLFGERISRAFAEVKLAFDPDNVFNPGKKVPEEMLRAVAAGRELDPYEDLKQDQARPLRYGSGYQTIRVAPYFNWSRDGGFSRAVEMCNGSGDCRKMTDVMCPSFQAIREEEHSTRGRANLLRAAISGNWPSEDLTGDRIHEALDLCLGCKACKAECPSSVDMAKIKAEVLAQRHARHGVPLQARLFGHIHALNRLAAPMASLANSALATPAARRMLQQVTGLHPARSLPLLAAEPFTRWFSTRPSTQHSSFIVQRSAFRDRVALFPDTFTTFNYPQIGKAAVKVLEAAGFGVQLAPRVCCGRPMLSQGLVEDARDHARRNVDLLHPLAAQGLPILVCEPSCASTFHDEYADLLPGDPRVTAIAGHVRQIDDWLAEQLGNGLALPLKTMPRQVLFHGHCHQKASGGTTGSLAVLQAIPGQQVIPIDAGCCGMAGAFGYTVDHYALSEAIARNRLIPAIEAAPNAVLCADGASCRQQIEHFTGRPARHVVEILADALH